MKQVCLIVETSAASEEPGARGVEAIYGPFPPHAAAALQRALRDWHGGRNEATVTIAELTPDVP